MLDSDGWEDAKQNKESPVSYVFSGFLLYPSLSGEAWILQVRENWGQSGQVSGSFSMQEPNSAAIHTLM